MSWIAAAIIGGSVITAGSGLIGASMNDGQPNVQNQFTPGPLFDEGKQATDAWLKQLTTDQSDPNWGAISPDWNDIWQQTQKQVQQYYNGTATSPGVNDQIKASFAQRGMSGDPAASYLMSASGANQASDLSNLGAQQNIAKQQFANQGKTQWLNSIQNFQNQTANSQSGGNWGGQVISPTSGQQMANVLGTVGSGLASTALQYNGQRAQLAYLNSLNGNNGMTFAPAAGSATGGGAFMTNNGYGF